MKFNAPLAREVLIKIENNPEEWDQGSWRCDTGMCFAGWAVALTPGVSYICPPNDPEYQELVEVDLDVYPELRDKAITIRQLLTMDYAYVDDPDEEIAKVVEEDFKVLMPFPGVTLDTPVMQINTLAGHLLGVAEAKTWGLASRRSSPESARDIFGGANSLHELTQIVAEYQAEQE